MEVARSRKQRLVAYFFEGQVDEGLVPWSKLQCKEPMGWSGGSTSFFDMWVHHNDMWVHDVDWPSP